MSDVICLKYRHNHWPSRQERLTAMNRRLSELRLEDYKCEVISGEEAENGEVKVFDLVRAIRFPEAVYVRPEDT